jgi:uncharacterized protein YcaQ
MDSIRSLSPTIARRLAITRQRLAGPRPRADATVTRQSAVSKSLVQASNGHADSSDILEVMRDLGCLQLDPISVVARSHLLVLWSRLGNYDRAELDKLLWQERHLFEYWAHAASIVLTEDYPIHQVWMRGYPNGDSKWSLRVRAWIRQNGPLRRAILAGLRREGPLPSRYFEEMGIPSAEWVSTGWSGGRNIGRMLDFLWMQGKIMVAGRAGLQKLWDLAERCLPEWTPREKLSRREMVRRAAQKSLHALGVATARQIEQHYTRWRYPDLPEALAELEAERRIERVHVREDGYKWKGDWYIHTEDVPLLDRLEAGEWEPRTTLLSPFDNLICDRARAQLLFNFKFGMEIYVPKAKRQYGYYVLPILHGDRLIGRIDPAMDRERGRLTVNAIHAEPDAPTTKASAKAVRRAIEELGAFLGAREIVYNG